MRGLQGGKADAGHAVELGFQRSPEEQVLQALGLGQRLGEAVCPFRVAVWGRLWKTGKKRIVSCINLFNSIQSSLTHCLKVKKNVRAKTLPVF